MVHARQRLCVLLSVVVIASAVAADESGSRAEVTPGAAKSVTTAKTAIKGNVSDPSGETYGVVGASNSPDGAGLAAANTGGGPDLVLDGGEDGEADAILSQAGIDRPSASHQGFTLHNSGGGRLDLYVEGILFGDGAGLTNVNAALFDGMTPDQFALDLELATSGLSSVHWDNLTDVPSGLSDGDDDTLGDLVCSDEQVARWIGGGWVCSHTSGVTYARTHVVGPVGIPEENGLALLGALADIPAPGSPEEARLLKIEPGVYDVGTTPFVMKSWVDVEGSGEATTWIRGDICESSGGPPTTGVLVGAERAELRSLSVENGCSVPGEQAAAMYNASAHARFTSVSARVTGAAYDHYGVANTGDDVAMLDVAAFATGASHSNRAIDTSGDRVRISGSTATATLGGSNATALEVGGQNVVIQGVTASAFDAPIENYGVAIYGQSVTLRNVVATAHSTSGTEHVGVYASEATFRMEGGIAEGVDGVFLTQTGSTARMIVLDHVTINGSQYGIWVVDYSSGLLDTMVNHCSIRGVSNSIRNWWGDVFVGGSQLAGGAVSNSSGNATCAGVWDESYTFYSNTCP